jgi:gliding motility-associated-like protein
LYIVSLAHKISAQQLPLLYEPEQDACHALPVCGNFHCPFTYFGVGSVLDVSSGWPWPVSYVSEGNSVWLKLKIGSPGTLVFTINPDQTDDNFDFSVYKNANCNSLAWPGAAIRSNHSLSSGATGLAVNPATYTAPNFFYGWIEYPFSDSIYANSGDEYLILINWEAWTPGTGNTLIINPSVKGFSVDFSGSTAVLATSMAPGLSGIRPTCNTSQEVTLQFSDPVQCSSIAPDGSDFYITPPLANIMGAYSEACLHPSLGAPSGNFPREITLKFDTPLPPGNYSVHAQHGIDGNSVEGLCGTELPVGDSIQFTVDPYIPITFTGVDSPACQFLQVSLSRRVLWDSIAADGSDFKITGPSAVSVQSAIGMNRNENDQVDRIQITLAQPVKVPGTYRLAVQRGSDFNTLEDSCTGQMIPGSYLDFQVTDPYNGLLAAAPDTVLCKADTIQLRSVNVLSPDQSCGLDTSGVTLVGIQMTQNTPGAPVTIYDFPFWGFTPSTPFTYAIKGAKSQLLILASELEEMGLKAGAITKLGWTLDSVMQRRFNHNSAPLNTIFFVRYTDFTIKLACTNKSDLGVYITPPLEAGQQIVFHTTDYYPHPGINEFTLDKPYIWDGFSNLLIEICTSADSLYRPDGSYREPLLVKDSKTNNNSYRLFASDDQDGCTIDGSTTAPQQQKSQWRPLTFITMVSLPSDGQPNQWSPASDIIGSPSQDNPFAFLAQTTGFTVTAVDRFGCYLKDSVTGIVSALNPSVSPMDTSICIGNSVQLTADAGTSPANYNWLSPAPLSLSCLSCNDPIATPQDSTIYSLIVRDNYGCADTLPVAVNIMPLPEVIAYPSDTIIKYGSSIQLNVTGADFYSWAPGRELDIPVGASPVATPTEPTDFIVIGLASYGCRNADTIHVDIDYNINTFIPSAFSPNGDGKNDLFRIVNLGFQKVQEFRVFNRWGQEVFAAFDNRGWDGAFRGVLQDNGVYNYLIRLGVPNGASKTYKGDVTLLR